MKSQTLSALVALIVIGTSAAAQELPEDLVTTITYCADVPSGLSEAGLPSDFMLAAEQAGRICVQLQMPLFQFVEYEDLYPGPYDDLEYWRYDERMTAALIAGNEQIVIRPVPDPSSPTGAEWSRSGTNIGSCPYSSAGGSVRGQPSYEGVPLDGVTQASAGVQYYLIVGCEGGCGLAIEYDPAGPPAPAYSEAVNYGDTSCIPSTLTVRFKVVKEDGTAVSFEFLGEGRSFEVRPSLTVSTDRDFSWGGLKSRFQEGSR